MNWTDYLQQHQVILLFLIIALGFLFGRVKLWGFSFDSSGILFVAMLFGHLGFTLNTDLQTLGLILFIYAIGLQAGPSVFNISKQRGLTIYLLVFQILAFGASLTFLFSVMLDIDMPLAIGLFSGAMTSTPGLAAAQEATRSTLTSTGYGVAYPFGVIGVVLFIKLLPRIFKVSLKEEEQRHKQLIVGSRPKIIRQNLEITNKTLDGKNLREINFSKTTRTVITRLLHDEEVIIPGPNTRLHTSDIVRIVGLEEDVRSAIPYLGRASDKEIPDIQRLESRRFVVTNKDIVGKTIGELHIHDLYNMNITRIRRSDIEFMAEPNQKLSWGDRVQVVGESSQMPLVRKLFGDEMKKVEYGNIFSIILGILLGIFVGLIPFSIGKAFAFNLGITGGVLLAGLFLSNRGKVGPVIWQVPIPIIAFMRELGLTLFLAVIGIKAGSEIFHIFQADGARLLLAGALITVLPMAVVTWLARKRHKMLLIELAGVLCGGMTSSPGLNAAAGLTESQAPLIMYATVYPFAMILMMVFVKILALF
ncbi:MAG TPA: transporter [Calditrichaeota bacterium]|nr:transporter [Calditrichota bacterium]